jgi:hypothetical protein
MRSPPDGNRSQDTMQRPSRATVPAGDARERTSRPWASAWGGVVAAAFVNGSLHRVYAPLMPELTATQLSEVLLPLLVAPWVLRVERLHPLPDHASAVAVGAGWALATVAFEFVFGHYVNGDSWDALLAAYNVAHGRLWSLDVVAIAAAPLLARAWRRDRINPTRSGTA